ncbi:MAG TPA: CAP domain-containing protein [Sandaracinaceae bacterium LLY-WYZ-13_1]|nr:CAP domain-containing protein [Sandaracinaceae bacterium LLY-WYZ-13_1]
MNRRTLDTGPRGTRPPRVALLALALAACGGGTQGGSTIGTEQTFREVEAPAPSVPTYVTEPPSGEAALGEHAAAVRAGVEAAAEEHAMPVEGDPRLARLAQWVAERLGPDGEPPPNRVVEFFARHLGLVEPVPHIMVLGQPSDSLGEGVTRSVGQFMDRQTYNRWGAAVVERSNLAVAVVMLSWRWTRLEAVPRRVEAGAPLALRGALLGDHRNPAVVVAQPDGEVRRLPAGSGPDFDVRVPTDEAGVYQVEVVGRGAHGDTVIANFPVYVGREIPEVVRLEAEEDAGGRDVESVRRELLELLNETRRRAGLGELQPHEGLRDVALGHSRDMAENDFIGHTSPRTGTAADRVREAQLPTGLVLENIGRGYGAQEIHRGLMESPGHRANLVNPDVTHVGIGVVAQPEGARSAFIVTEVFTRMAERQDLTGAPERIVALINRARNARGAAPLSLEEHLSEAAQEAAERFFEDPSLSQQDTVDDASAALRRFGIAYRRLGGVMAVVTDVEEAGALEPTFDPDVRHVGIGVAQGSRPDTGPNAIAVVIVLAWPR